MDGTINAPKRKVPQIDQHVMEFINRYMKELMITGGSIPYSEVQRMEPWKVEAIIEVKRLVL
jgi:hypothetical protein